MVKWGTIFLSGVRGILLMQFSHLVAPHHQLGAFFLLLSVFVCTDLIEFD